MIKQDAINSACDPVQFRYFIIHLFIQPSFNPNGSGTYFVEDESKNTNYMTALLSTDCLMADNTHAV